MIKRIISVLLLTVMLALCACGGDGTAETTAEQEQTAPVTEEPDDDTDYISAKDFYNDGYSNNSLVGIDKFGRKFDVSVPKTDKERNVGLFYFLTLGQHPEKVQSDKIFDVSKILEMENGLDIMFSDSYYDENIAPEGALYFWGEPLYGYYNMGDIWVIRRHLQLLTEAGVDFLCFDVTNAVTYDAVFVKIMKEICTLRQKGFDAPQVVFYTHAYSMNVVRMLYNNLYKRGLYQDAWFMYNGKPLIVAYTNVEDDCNPIKYNPEPLSDEILEFFSFKRPEWPDEYKTYSDSMPWIEWTYPAPLHTDVVNVSVAAHIHPPMSQSIYNGLKSYGRGWSVSQMKNISEDAEKGTYFAYNWKNAVKQDPDIVFVTGWNEWTAEKFKFTGRKGYMLVDLADMEFSRDIEMMKGGYEDSFYLQLCDYIRQYKNTALEDTKVKSEPVNIMMSESTAEWNKVRAVYKSVGSDNSPRNSAGAASSVKYYQAPARNNIYEIRVIDDDEYVYFYVKTDDVITEREENDEGWMNIFIGIGDLEETGWNGYEYIINRHFSGSNVTKIEKLSGDFTSEECGDGIYYVHGNILQVKIPKEKIGLQPGQTFYFKVADGIEKPDDIMDYYVSGRSLPMGRLSFRYMG